MIQQRLLSTTDQVDESRFSPDLAAALLNDCKTAMNRITTVCTKSSSIQSKIINKNFSLAVRRNRGF